MKKVLILAMALMASATASAAPHFLTVNEGQIILRDEACQEFDDGFEAAFLSKSGTGMYGCWAPLKADQVLIIWTTLVGFDGSILKKDISVVYDAPASMKGGK